MLDLRRLRLLSELARRGTIAEVAKVVGYTPSAISQSLAQLERETGVALLARDRRARESPSRIVLQHPRARTRGRDPATALGGARSARLGKLRAGGRRPRRRARRAFARQRAAPPRTAEA